MTKKITPEDLTGRVGGRIPADMHRALLLVSAQTGEPINALLIDALDKAISARAKKVPFALPWPPAPTK